MAITAASLDTLSSVLKDFYLGPIQDQLNQEVLALDLFEKATVDWNGKQVIIPVHVGRNTGVGFRAEGGTLPDANAQDFANLTVTAKFLYGRFTITGPAIAAAKSGGKNSFIGYVDAEMNKLVNDVRNEANKTCFSGGDVVGYLNEKKDAGVGVAWDFTGDIAKAQATQDLVQAEGNQLAFDVIRMDTYAVLGDDIQVGNITDGMLTTGQVDLENALDSSAVPEGVALACVMVEDGGQASAAIAALADEPTGIFGNLSSVSHFGVDRSDAGGNNEALQSVVHCVQSADGGGDPRADISLGELQRLLDEISIASDGVPNLFLVHPSFRQEYAQILMGTSAGNLTKEVSNVGKADGGFASLSYNNIAFRVSRHAPKGGVIALKTDTWKLCQLEAGGFADLDGNVLSRRSAQDEWEGFYRWYYDVTCLRPKANGALIGLNYPGAA